VKKPPKKKSNSVESFSRFNAFVILALWTLSITQPLLNALGDAATFFVAHDANKLHIFGFVLLLVFIGPMILIGTSFIAGKMNKKLGLIAHLLITGILASGFFLVLFNNILQTVPTISVVLSVVLGTIVATFLARIDNIPGLGAFSGLLAIACSVLFLFFTPVSSIGTASKKADFTKVDFAAEMPVVLLVFDEFSPIALLDKDNQIDPVRFPNIAKLAGQSSWFPNTMATHNFTYKAVPGILTGKLPPAENLPPTQANYKNNLFTLLGEQYEFNVVDLLTTLCPQDYCPDEQGINTFKVQPFMSDIEIVLKHIYYPKTWAEEYLPALNEGWKDFSSKKPEIVESNIPDPIKFAQVKSEGLFFADDIEMFQSFLDNIKPGKQTLDYIYLVFPHTPWEYLPDGRTYGGLPITHNWDSEATVEEVYHRYLLQLGVVDTMIGDLVDRLNSVNKYDDALIIVTADHGLNFKAGISSRNLVNPAVLHVPLLIKKPHQKVGQVNEKFVSNIDIVPTIADILGIKIPWSDDGNSVFDDSFPERSDMKMYTSPTKMTTFARNDIVNFDAVPHRIKKFGERSSLDTLSNAGTHGQLLGRTTDNLDDLLSYFDTAPTIEANFEDFLNVDLSANRLPVIFKGKVTLPEASEDSFSVAIALNGEISTTALTQGTGKGRSFKAILPPAKIQNGSNRIDAYLIRENSLNQTELIKIPNKSYSIISESDGSVFIENEAGERFQVTNEKVVVSFKARRQDRDKLIEFSGWAVDGVEKVPPSIFVMFYKDNFARTVNVDRLTPDLAKAFNAEEALAKSGFAYIVSSEVITNPEDVQLYAIFPEGFAAALPE